MLLVPTLWILFKYMIKPLITYRLMAPYATSILKSYIFKEGLHKLTFLVCAWYCQEEIFSHLASVSRLYSAFITPEWKRHSASNLPDSCAQHLWLNRYRLPKHRNPWDLVTWWIEQQRLLVSYIWEAPWYTGLNPWAGLQCACCRT